MSTGSCFLVINEGAMFPAQAGLRRQLPVAVQGSDPCLACIL